MIEPIKSAKSPVIQLVRGAEFSSSERLLRRILPACVASAGIHVGLAAGVWAFATFMPVPTKAEIIDKVEVAVEERADKPEEKNLTETVETIDDSSTTVAIEDVKVDDKTVASNVTDVAPAGMPDGNLTIPQDVLGQLGNIGTEPLPGLNNAGAGVGSLGAGNLGFGAVNDSLKGRGQATTKNALLRSGGGNKESELAVARGVAWLAKQQKANGSFVFDRGETDDTVAATGMALLPFLAAGQTHKPAPGQDKTYKSTVLAAIDYLLSIQKPDGSFRTGDLVGMYSNAIATVALCEAYGMTGDKPKLLEKVQRAIRFIELSQGPNGSWGYKPKTDGDTSIVGWQIQALHSAKLCKDIKVDPKVFERAMKFLDSVATGASKHRFGYNSPGGGSASLTAVGLLCRYYLNAWGPNSAGLRDGAEYLLKTHSPGEKTFDMYYYYYATQVLHFYGGDAWQKEWNPKMRDYFIKLQVKQPGNPKVDGSWDPDKSEWIGPKCGRLGTTCFVLLSLEVYYRHLPLYNRGSGGKTDLEMK